MALALLPLPEGDRPEATVLDREGGILRQGLGGFVCLADSPEDGFHVACYHGSLEPYMARGRALRAAGLDNKDSIERRWVEIDAGELEMPRHPAALFQLFGEAPPTETGDASGLTSLTVLYVAYQKAQDLGLPETPAEGRPWLMFPGKPSAHIMISG